jgi:Fe-S cluster biogenesis protein NfuA
LDKDKTNKIEQVLSEVRPYIRMHGGDVELVEVKDKTVIIEISGACAGCSLAELTYNKGVSDLIKEKVPEVEKIIFRQSATPIRE